MPMVYNVTVSVVGTQTSVSGLSGQNNGGTYTIHLTRSQFDSLSSNTGKKYDLSGMEVGVGQFNATMLNLRGAGDKDDKYVFGP